MEQRTLEELVQVEPQEATSTRDEGTFDFADGAAQMEAVHRALTVYFETSDWLEERRRQSPGIG